MLTWSLLTTSSQINIIIIIIIITTQQNPSQEKGTYVMTLHLQHKNINMAAKLTLSSPFSFKTSFLPKSPSFSLGLYSPRTNVTGVKVHAKLGNIHAITHFPLLQFYITIIPSLWIKWGWDDKLRNVDLILLGGGDEQAKKGGKKKFITREEEPQQ